MHLLSRLEHSQQLCESTIQVAKQNTGCHSETKGYSNDNSTLVEGTQIPLQVIRIVYRNTHATPSVKNSYSNGTSCRAFEEPEMEAICLEGL